jgi:hypothetical protein
MVLLAMQTLGGYFGRRPFQVYDNARGGRSVQSGSSSLVELDESLLMSSGPRTQDRWLTHSESGSPLVSLSIFSNLRVPAIILRARDGVWDDAWLRTLYNKLENHSFWRLCNCSIASKRALRMGSLALSLDVLQLMGSRRV